MQEQKKLTWFRQLGFSLGMGWQGLCFTAAGAFGVYMGLRELLAGSMLGLVVMLFTGLFLGFGLSLLLRFFQRVDITDKEVILRFRSIVLRRIPIEQIQTLGVAAMRLPTERRTREVEVIVLSPRSPKYIRTQVGTRGWERKLGGIRFSSEQDREHAITRYAIRAYLRGQLSGLAGIHLPKSEGIWLEYSPDRAEELKKLLPHAENYIY